MDAGITVLLAFFCLLLVILASYAVSRSGRITRLEKDVDELKKKEEKGADKLTELRDFSVSARHDIEALNIATAEIKEGFREQERKREEFLKEIKMLVPASINEAMKPIMVEISHINRALEAKK